MDQVKIGKFILDERKKKGYTQKELADILAVSDKTISKWENGKGIPDISILLPLCEEFGISVNELLSGERLSEIDYKNKAEENFVKLVQENQLSKSKPMKGLWSTVYKICIYCVAMPMLIFTLIFMKSAAAEPLAINVAMWIVLGLIAKICDIAEKHRLEKHKKTGKSYEAMVTDILPSALFHIGNYVTCRLVCTYNREEREHSATSGYLLLTHFCKKEDLHAIVYVDAKKPEKYSVEIRKTHR